MFHASAGRRRQVMLASSMLLSPALLAGTSLLPHVAATATAQTAGSLPTIVVEPLHPRRAARSRPKPDTNTGRASPAHEPQVMQETPPIPPGGGGTVTSQTAFQRALSTSDSASLVTDLPGGAVWGAGGVSSLPALNGFGADRVQVAINSMLISPGCPNEMNPPLSFVNPAMIAKMRTYLGIAPVSTGGDYIGGRIDVTTAPPAFAAGTAGWLTRATLSGFYRSNGNAYGVDATAAMANRDTSITYTGGWV
jgi:iron complex outermembrane receptor protein